MSGSKNIIFKYVIVAAIAAICGIAVSHYYLSLPSSLLDSNTIDVFVARILTYPGYLISVAYPGVHAGYNTWKQFAVIYSGVFYGMLIFMIQASLFQRKTKSDKQTTSIKSNEATPKEHAK